MTQELNAVLATEVGIAAYLRIYCSGSSCPGKPIGRRGSPLGYHNAKVRIATSEKKGDFDFAGGVGDYEEGWPEACDGCGSVWGDLEEERTRQVFYQRLYDTPSGELGPGCLFWVDWEHWEQPIRASHRNGRRVEWAVPTACPHGWKNCDGLHLHAICPDGHEWDTSGRASNCTKPDDQEHRCWVVTGDPPNVTAGKGGNTCSAGAGSIATPTWHGFLHQGRFVLQRPR